MDLRSFTGCSRLATTRSGDAFGRRTLIIFIFSFRFDSRRITLLCFFEESSSFHLSGFAPARVLRFEWCKGRVLEAWNVFHSELDNRLPTVGVRVVRCDSGAHLS